MQPITHESDFLASLDPQQRRWYLQQQARQLEALRVLMSTTLGVPARRETPPAPACTTTD